MPELESDTHGLVAAGALGTAAGDTVLETFTLPAGGPHNIFYVYCQVVQATQVAADAIIGHFRLNAPSGDLEPNPSPSRFPYTPQPSHLGTVLDVSLSPLVLIPVNYTAPGKSQLEFIVNQRTANTVAPQAVGGIIFGKELPQMPPFQFMDNVRVQVTAATDTSVGTITLAEKATKIVAICGMLCQDNVITTAEELLGFFRLASDDIKMPPAEFPFDCAFSAGLSTTIVTPSSPGPVFIPVNIPVEGGARVDVFVDLNTAVTNAAEASIFIAYV